MNREQAKIYLRSSGFSEEQINTIEQAFKKEPYGKLVLSHNEISGQIYAYIGNEKHNITKEAIEAVQAIKALEQEPCEMTAEEYRRRMIQAFHNADTGELIAVCVFPTEKEFEFLEWLLKNHYKKEPCNDVISRRAAIDAIEKTKSAMATDGEIYVAKINAEMNIQQLPSVSTEKTWQWIDVEGYEGLLCKCSNCCKDGERYKHRTHQSKTNFCPDCGAKMGVKE